MDYRKRLLTVATRYADATNLSLARVATLITGGGVFFKRLEEGRGCTVDSYENCLQWFSNHWPSEATWPDGVARPEPKGEAA